MRRITSGSPCEHLEVSRVALVHHETTTGLLNPVAEVAQVAHALGRHVIVDAMSSLFGERLDVTQDGIDFVAASANKCLQGIPGVSFVIARRSAVDALAGMLPAGITYDALHDAMKRRGYIIYAGQGAPKSYAFRVANMGTLTPRDMEGVVAAFAASTAECDDDGTKATGRVVGIVDRSADSRSAGRGRLRQPRRRGQAAPRSRQRARPTLVGEEVEALNAEIRTINATVVEDPATNLAALDVRSPGPTSYGIPSE